MLKTRILTAAVLIALLLCALFLLPESGWIAFCALVLGIAGWEWAGLAALAGGGRYVYAAFIVALFVVPNIVSASGANGAHVPVWAYYAAALFWVVLAPLWIWRWPHIGGRLVLLAVGLTILVPASAALVDLRGVHPSLLLAVLIVVWVSDTAAYLFGRRFGKHKLAPAISPGKTWEGVFGALAAVTLYAFAWAALGSAASMPVWPGGARAAAAWILPVLLVLAVVGMIGDLFESLLKRQAGVKDSGTLLPGHGGVLDRIDAPMAMLPLAVLAFAR